MKGLIFFLTGLWCLSTQVYAQSLSMEESYARNSPGVVMVQTVFSGTVYVRKVDLNQYNFNKLVDSIKALDPLQNMLSASQKLDILLSALYRSPTRFFSPTFEYLSQRHRFIANGTGFFISGDGYVLTNCHVIDRDSTYIQRQFMLSTFQELTESSITSLEQSWQVSLSDEQRNTLFDVYGFLYSRTSPMQLSNVEKQVNVVYRIGNEKNNDEARIKKQAKVLIKGAAMPGKDVAILKIDDVHNLPSLKIAREDVPRIGSRALVIGFPDPVGNHAFLAKESANEPTLTVGVISSIKESVNNFPVIQMDATIAHGSSGSPVCDEKGEVIGLATFGSIERRSNTLASGFNFAVPVSVIRSFIDSLKILPDQSDATDLYNQGLQFFYTSYYRKALAKFKEVERINANYPMLYSFMTDAERKAASDSDKQNYFEKYFFRIMAVFLILAGIYIYIRRLGARRAKFMIKS